MEKERFDSLKLIFTDENIVEFKSPGYFVLTNEMETEMDIVFREDIPLELIQRRDSVYCISFVKGWEEVAFDVQQFNFYVDAFPSVKLVVT